MVMSSNHTATRRSVLAGAASGATSAMLATEAVAQTAPRGPFTVEGWKAAWADPSPERVRTRVPLIAAPDIAGYWPRTTRPVRGPQEYGQRIVDLLTFIPDFRAELKEYAVNGDVMFIRWVARGTGPNGPFEALGADRLLVPNGYVAENLILSDHPIFAELAKHVGDLRMD
jgi:hypothetical protein